MMFALKRKALIEQLENYNSDFEEEYNYISRFLDLLKYPNCYERSLEFGHITASAWITDEEQNHVLLMHHLKLDRWLQPGGHADGEENVVAVAEKEMQEETGLTSYTLSRDEIFDIDIHRIPEMKGIPSHDHYDLRFHFIAQNTAQAKKNSESKELRWVELSEIPELVNNEKSILRMISKLRT